MRPTAAWNSLRAGSGISPKAILIDGTSKGGWTAKLDRALAQGYDGIRVAGNALWFEENDWKEFCEYENDLNGLITDQRMTVLCTYPVAARSAGEILDIARAHQFAIAKRKDN